MCLQFGVKDGYETVKNTRSWMSQELFTKEMMRAKARIVAMRVERRDESSNLSTI